MMFFKSSYRKLVLNRTIAIKEELDVLKRQIIFEIRYIRELTRKLSNQRELFQKTNCKSIDINASVDELTRRKSRLHSMQRKYNSLSSERNLLNNKLKSHKRFLLF